MGLECDKMSVAAAELHWKSYTKRIIDRLKSKGIPLAGIILDSHEAGAQNWTDDMLVEFARRRGYDLRPYLPLMAGYCVAENAEDVLADFRRTCVELIAERYYGTFDRLCRDEGLSFTAQTGGGMFMIADSVFSKKYVSIPEGEFWGYQKFGAYDVKDASSAAHLYGKKIASAEAMTDASYKMTIPELRRRCDLAFAFGANSMTVCAVPHLPKKDCGVKAPTGPREYGLNRSNPWWEDSRPFWDYIAFCSWMLRQGDPAPEALFYAGDDVPVKIIASKVPKALDGLDWDFATGDAAARMTKTADAWTTPEGVRYGYVVDSEGRTLAGAPPARRLNLPHISRLLPSVEKLAFIANDTEHEVKVDLGGESAVVIDPWTRCQTTESSVVIPPGESRFVKSASAADPVQKCESDGTSRVIRNDSWWNTVDGKPIYSNGGGCYFYEGRWYWYGCRYEEAERVRFDSSFQVDVGGLHTTFVGVTCYSSDDLVNWRDEGIVYAGEGAESEAHGRWFGRVGVAAVPSEGKFVLAMQYMGGVLLAVADSPRGPFVFQEGVDMTASIGYRTTGDQAVFYDDIHGKGYLVFSKPHGRQDVCRGTWLSERTRIRGHPATCLHRARARRELHVHASRQILPLCLRSLRLGWIARLLDGCGFADGAVSQVVGRGYVSHAQCRRGLLPRLSDWIFRDGARRGTGNGGVLRRPLDSVRGQRNRLQRLDAAFLRRRRAGVQFAVGVDARCRDRPLGGWFGKQLRAQRLVRCRPSADSDSS